MNGLSINEDEFIGLPQKKQMLILYRNSEAIKNKIDGFKFHQKVQYTALAGLAAVVGFLANRLL